MKALKKLWHDLTDWMLWVEIEESYHYTKKTTTDKDSRLITFSGKLSKKNGRPFTMEEFDAIMDKVCDTFDHDELNTNSTWTLNDERS